MRRIIFTMFITLFVVFSGIFINSDKRLVFADNSSASNLSTKNEISTDGKSDNSQLDKVSKVLECGYYIVGIFAFISIFNSSKQSKLLAIQCKLLADESAANKKVALDTFKRETASITIKQCTEYAEKIVPKITECLKEIREKEIPKYDRPLNIEAFNDKTMYSKFLKSNIYNDDKLYKICIDTANLLEAYSMNFTGKICDESIAFGSIGDTFTKGVEFLYPYILQYRIQYRSNGYSNILNLYDRWCRKLNDEELCGRESELEQIEEQLRREKERIKNEKHKNSYDDDIRPIGLG